MTFADSKEEAIRKRMNIRAMGLCSCYTRLKSDPSKYFVQNCPTNLCKEARRK
jgi:hypothetical protein